MNEDKKTNVKFKDGNNNLYDVKIEITHRNGYSEFSMSGEGQGSRGQCYDSIKPKNAKQERLLELWKTYHLNGMNAGTPKQTEMIKEMQKNTSYSYDKALLYLNSYDKDCKPISIFDLKLIEDKKEELKEQISKHKKHKKNIEDVKTKYDKNFCWGGKTINLKSLGLGKKFFINRTKQKHFFDKLKKKECLIIDRLQKELEQEQEKTMLYDRGKDGKLYKYDATLHRVDLPENLWEEVEQLVKDIREIEEKSRVKGGSWEDLNEYKKVALGKHLKLEPKEAEEDITEEYEGVYSYCGVEYYVLTEDEAQEKCEEFLGDELWQIAVESGNTEMGKQEWIEWVIKQDGYGQILNQSNGTEYFDEENEVYIMRV